MSAELYFPTEAPTRAVILMDQQEQAQGEKGLGCFYTINTLMVLFLLVPVLILLVLFILWLIPD